MANQDECLWINLELSFDGHAGGRKRIPSGKWLEHILLRQLCIVSSFLAEVTQHSFRNRVRKQEQVQVRACRARNVPVWRFLEVSPSKGNRECLVCT